MNVKETNNIAKLTRDLGWKANGKKYHHLLILLEYISLREALSLLLNKEETK
jgi:hypothetical protein